MSFSLDGDKDEILDDFNDFNDIQLVQHLPIAANNLKSSSQTKKPSLLSYEKAQKAKVEKKSVLRKKSIPKKPLNLGANLIMRSETKPHSSLLKTMTATKKTSFTFLSSVSHADLSNHSALQTNKLSSLNENCSTDGSSFLLSTTEEKSLKTDDIPPLPSHSSEILVRDLKKAYTNTSKSLKKNIDCVVDDDLQLGLALSASLQLDSSFNPSQPSLDTTPVLEIDYKTGLLKYPSAVPRKKTIITQILPVEKAKQVTQEAAAEYLLLTSSPYPNIKSHSFTIQPSLLPWKDVNLTYWKLSSAFMFKENESNINIHGFDPTYTQLREDFIENSPLISILNSKVANLSPDSSQFKLIQQKKEQLAAELYSLLETTISWSHQHGLNLLDTTIRREKNVNK